jgi:hypothetical protein
VINGSDSGAGSLRQAITDANGNANDPTVDQIQVNFVGGINLLSQLPLLSTPMTINGSGVTSVNVRRSPTAATQFRLFAVSPAAGQTDTIQGMTISGARATGFGGGAMIKSGAGNLILNSVWITNNQTPTLSGGGVSCDAGSISIRNATLSSNLADFGGGVAASSTCTEELVNTTIAGNSANSFGGGIYISDTSHITVNSSTVAGNKADADDTGGGEGGGSYNASGGTAPTFSVANDIYAGNTVGTSGGTTQTQCGGGDHTSSGYNLRTVADSGCTGFADSTDFINASPMLGTLGLNVTGPPTIALLPGSPAINAGNPATPADNSFPACPATDERALPRGAGGNRCDIGAFEVQRNTTITGVTCAPASLTLGVGSTICTATVTDSGSSPTNPTGTVNFASNGIGTFSGGGGSCSLVGDAGQPSCQVTYTPTAVGSGSHQITGIYGGDANHEVSQGAAQVGVLSPVILSVSPTAPPPKRAAAIKKCKKKFPKGPKRKKCIKKAKKRFPA